MTKRLIDIDAAKAAAAQEVLGTTSVEATIDVALDELIALDVRRRSLIGLETHPSELADPAARRAAWG